VPRIGSFYNPSFCCCRMSYLLYLFFFSTMTHVRNVSSFESFSFYFWKVISLIKTYTDSVFMTVSELLHYPAYLFTAFISCVFADVIITTDTGIPCWSVNTWRLVPMLLPLSVVGLGPTCHFPLNVPSQICYQEVIAISIHPLPIRSS